ncbi:hypothetical protein Vi05172_g4766 [Venturia inaequalis]|nr:hypothetical protein Vi05172_g4766 [Venturia inaequalis]
MPLIEFLTYFDHDFEQYKSGFNEQHGQKPIDLDFGIEDDKLKDAVGN